MVPRSALPCSAISHSTRACAAMLCPMRRHNAKYFNARRRHAVVQEIGRRIPSTLCFWELHGATQCSALRRSLREHTDACNAVHDATAPCSVLQCSVVPCCRSRIRTKDSINSVVLGAPRCHAVLCPAAHYMRAHGCVFCGALADGAMQCPAVLSGAMLLFKN